MSQHHDPVSFGSPRFSTVAHGAFEVTAAYFPARLHLEPHTHERSVVAVTLSGRWTSRLGGRTCESAPGHVLVEPAGDRHSNDFAGGGARVLIVQPDPAAAELLNPCRRLLTSLAHRPSVATHAVALRLARELARPDDLSPLAVQGLCLELLATAGREHARTPVARAPWLRVVEDYLREHFRDTPALQTLAKLAGVHPSHLARAFRRQYGMSPAQFLRARRLEWALAALRETREPIAAIAHQAGFADQSHFTRLFRGATGLTPARFRAWVQRVPEARNVLDDSGRSRHS